MCENGTTSMYINGVDDSVIEELRGSNRNVYIMNFEGSDFIDILNSQAQSRATDKYVQYSIRGKTIYLFNNTIIFFGDIDTTDTDTELLHYLESL